MASTRLNPRVLYPSPLFVKLSSSIVLLKQRNLLLYLVNFSGKLPMFLALDKG